MNKVCKPDYTKSLVNLSNSILQYFECPTHHSTLPELDKFLEKEYKTIVLLVLDGMGVDMLEQNLSPKSFLRTHIKDKISSVFPPTTTAATSSIYSGYTPQEHGWAGWQCYFKEYGRNIELFLNRDFYSGENLKIDINKEFQPPKKLFEQINEQGKYKAYGVARFWGGYDVESMNDVCDKIVELSKGEDKKFILAYYKEPDSTMHHTGCYSDATKKEIKSLDRKVEKLARNLKDSILIITADHGLIDIKEDVRLDKIKEINDCLRLPPAIEPRAVAFYVKEDKKEQFEKEFNKRFGNDFILMTSDEYLHQGYAGEGTMHPKFREFLGDYMALATGSRILQYQTEGGIDPVEFKAHHAGLTAKEMIVPLIIYQSDK